MLSYFLVPTSLPREVSRGGFHVNSFLLPYPNCTFHLSVFSHNQWSDLLYNSTNSLSSSMDSTNTSPHLYGDSGTTPHLPHMFPWTCIHVMMISFHYTCLPYYFSFWRWYPHRSEKDMGSQIYVKLHFSIHLVQSWCVSELLYHPFNFV